jgi:hypothetical protein
MADIGVHASGVSCEPLTFPTLDTQAPAAAAPERPRELEPLLGRLLFASRDLANHHIKVSRSRPTQEPVIYCEECQMAALGGRLLHSASCRAGIVLEILEAICAGASVTPVRDAASNPCRRKEDAPAAESAIAEDGKPSRAEFEEPWEGLSGSGRHFVGHEDGWHLAEVISPSRRVETRDRIAACVNFCAGIPTERLRAELPLASAERRRFCEINFLRRALPWLGVLPTEADDSAVLL